MSAATSCAEKAADLRALGDGDAGSADIVFQREALRELAVGRGGRRMRRRERLVELAAGLGALVEHQHVGAGAARGERGGKASRTRADDKHVDLPALGLGAGLGGERLQRIVGRAGGLGRTHLLSVGHFGQAGALAGLAVDGDEAVEACAHAAIETPALAAPGVAHRLDAAGRQRRGDGLAFQALDGLAVVPEAHGAPGRGDGRVDQSGAHGQCDGRTSTYG